MNQSYEQQDRYYRLLDYLKSLFKRENLCHNTYLFRQMNGSLAVPLYIIAEEKTVSQISRDQGLLIDALQNTGLVHVIEGKQVRIIEHPTIKINIKNHQALRQIQRILEQKDIRYQISKRYDHDQYINLTIFSQNIAWLRALLKTLAQQIDFDNASLLEDIKFGVQRIRRLKVEHAKQKTALGKTKYTMHTPPEVFVRKALESSDSDPSDTEKEEKPNKGYPQNGKTNGTYKKKNYKEKASKKPQISQQDFPQLNS